MDGLDLLAKGDLAAALEQQTALVRQQPADPDHRYNLAAMLTMRGELDRALGQLTTIGKLQPQLANAVAVYHGLLEAEEERRRVYAGLARASLPPDAPVGLDGRRELRARLAGGDAAQARAAMERLVAQPSGAGSIDGAPFARLVDADESLGDVLEVFAGGRYLWWPFCGIAALVFAPPRALLDFIWAPCELRERSGRTSRVHVPVLYCGSLGHADAAICRARRTEWVDEHEVAFRGFGQRIFAVDDGERPLLEVRRIEFAPAAVS